MMQQILIRSLGAAPLISALPDVGGRERFMETLANAQNEEAQADFGEIDLPKGEPCF